MGAWFRFFLSEPCFYSMSGLLALCSSADTSDLLSWKPEAHSEIMSSSFTSLIGWKSSLARVKKLFTWATQLPNAYSRFSVLGVYMWPSSSSKESSEGWEERSEQLLLRDRTDCSECSSASAFSGLRFGFSADCTERWLGSRRIAKAKTFSAYSGIDSVGSTTCILIWGESVFYSSGNYCTMVMSVWHSIYAVGGPPKWCMNSLLKLGVLHPEGSISESEWEC